jgi:hypothetical protein
VSALALQVAPIGSNETGRCECCGRVSRKVWGVVYRDRLTLATYYVHWTVGHVFETGADIDVILGKWGEGSSAEDRYAVRLAYRIFDHGPEMMVIDASHKHVSNTIAAQCLKRSDVIGSPLAQNVFDICDAFLIQDQRLAALWDAPGYDQA